MEIASHNMSSDAQLPHTLQQVPGAEPRVSIRNLNFYYGATLSLIHI